MINPKAQPCDSGAIRAARHLAGSTPGARNWVLVAAVLASTISYVDESVVNVALPAISTDLGASAAVIQWLVNAYTLCLAALVLVGGASGDRFGRRRIFVAGVVLFAAASAWCGLAGDVAQLIAARAVQGAGAALLIPCSLALIGASFDDASRGRAIGTWAGFSAIAAAIGPLLGGWIVDHASWRWIFLINPVLALPTLWIAWRHVPESKDAEAKSGIDWPGALLAFAGLGSLVYGLIAFPELGARDPRVFGSEALGVALLAAFVWMEWRSKNPMMPLGLFRSATFSGVNLLTLFLYGALGGAFFFLPFALIQVHGYSATAAGAVFLPFTIIMAVLSRWSGGLLDRFGARLPLVIGPTLASLGFALLALFGMADSYVVAFMVPIVVLGLGMAVAVAPLTTAVISAVPTHQAGVASGVNNAVASVASLLAVAVFGALALGLFGAAIDRHLAARPVAPQVRAAVDASRDSFAADSAQKLPTQRDRQEAQAILHQSLAQSIRWIMALAAAMALAGALCAGATIGPRRSPSPSPGAG